MGRYVESFNRFGYSRYRSLCYKMQDYLDGVPRVSLFFKHGYASQDNKCHISLFKTDSLDRVQTLINPFCFPIPQFCKSMPLLFKPLLQGQIVNLPPSVFPTKFYLYYVILLHLYLVFGYFFLFHNRNKMENIILKLFSLYQGNNSYFINDIRVE